MNQYATKYEYCLTSAGIEIAQLPNELQSLIQAYKTAYQVWENTDAALQSKWLFVLVNTDALICAKLYHLYRDKIKLPSLQQDKAIVNKVKLLALKAKALQLKWDK